MKDDCEKTVAVYHLCSQCRLISFQIFLVKHYLCFVCVCTRVTITNINFAMDANR